MVIKEILLSVLKKYTLLAELEEQEEEDLVEVVTEAGILYDSLFISLVLDIMQHKEELYSFLDFIEAEANTESNPYKLMELNEMLEVRKLVEAFDLEKVGEELESIGIEV